MKSAMPEDLYLSKHLLQMKIKADIGVAWKSHLISFTRNDKKK